MVHRDDHDGRPGSELRTPRRPRNEGPARRREWRISRVSNGIIGARGNKLDEGHVNARIEVTVNLVYIYLSRVGEDGNCAGAFAYLCALNREGGAANRDAPG